ncbi:hypothetical protein GCM10010988_25270 [Cnuibacter physcomitrellae]|uniref:Uncharacterized protein n=1 Tax=Cnuibacter physcomitrellae TaxID=1619308 RepID=A0A1X9LH64_9MICO|nr:LD-carboxypeptidase [Cnuibacter physcomitrellae]ARJ03862.1 hypothetical protein B5808_00395 [Cnuibacter physcomitrellae]GGI39678.1 hypothetical protein GCM10010988_25270 [Cnuibacter physcomitrellae]
MASITYPRALRPGARVEVPAPSMGVPAHLLPRLRAAVEALTAGGLDVHVRPHALVDGLTPASADARAEDLHAAFEEAAVVLPPWGGELAIELVELPPGSAFEQRSAPRRRSRPWGAWEDEPLDRDRAYDTPTRWRALDGTDDVAMRGRLIGGCLETVSLLAGTPYGDVPGFARRYAPEGTIVYLEAAESGSIAVLRMLTSLRLAGWFDDANGILIGRTEGAAVPELSQEDAVRRALGDLDLPVILDVDTGHQPPQLPLVNGALAEVRLDGAAGTIVQHLIP